MLIRQIWRRVFIGILTGMVLSACSGSNEQTETNESKTASSSSTAEAGTSEEAAVVRPEESEPLLYEGDLELPVNGATGYASIRMDLKAAADAGSETISALEAGTAFEVVEEVGDWWYVQTETESGWVQHLYCFINLPDVIPSISEIGWTQSYQVGIFLAVPLLLFYKGRQGKKSNVMKWGFYAFYPFHLLLLELVKIIVSA